MPEQRTVATVRKNAWQEIRIGLQKDEGWQIASLRLWFKAEDGTMLPGKDGLNFRVDLLHEALAEAVRAAASSSSSTIAASTAPARAGTRRSSGRSMCRLRRRGQVKASSPRPSS